MSDETKADGELNGEPKISKRAAAKAAKKADKAQKKVESLVSRPAKEKEPPKPAAEPNTDTDPMDDACKVGWLKDVYTIRPVAPDVFTRFPPEPNGYLHIGHAKAISVNFGFAKYWGGNCYLRYDDTNPVKEEEQYFNSIRETIEWLGYEPYKITYSSDNFDRLYELAEKLIKKDKAYVCHCSQEEINLQRGGKDNKGPRYACPHRNRPVDESLEEFRGMRDGKYKPKEVFLRMKMDIESGNPYMWDVPAYRITEQNHHHRTGDKWRIYPTYDYSHCLCDAFETITHSLCTTEFRTAREGYDWVLDQLQEFLPDRPQQREYARLKVSGTLLSKRKILKLINDGVVRGWDDPRLYTIIAIRRRGIPAGAIRAFVADVGVSDALTMIPAVRFETVVRRYLERTVPRLMLIPDPIRIVIDNLPVDYVKEISLDFMRGDPSVGTHTVPFTNTVYIDRSDFRTTDSPDFFRLSPGKTVGLLNVPHPIRATSFETDLTGRVTLIRAMHEKPAEGAPSERPRAFIQWVAESAAHKSPKKCEVRIFNQLFLADDPDGVNDINPNSEEIFPNALVETGFDWVKANAPWPKEKHVKNLHPGNWDVRFQGMRVAYFTLDSESTEDKIVLNKIVSLKEDAGKAAGT